MEPGRWTAGGDLSGDEVVVDPGSGEGAVERLDLSVEAMLAPHGLRELTPEEFGQHFGDLPTDGEG